MNVYVRVCVRISIRVRACMCARADKPTPDPDPEGTEGGVGKKHGRPEAQKKSPPGDNTLVGLLRRE